MNTYTVNLEPTATPEQLHELDSHISGDYKVLAPDEESALDLFHSTIPIKVLDDFNITITQD